MTLKQLIAVPIISAATLTGAWAYNKYKYQSEPGSNAIAASSIFKTAKFTENVANIPTADFEYSAAKASPAVVHIRIMQRQESAIANPPDQNEQDGTSDNSDMSYNDGNNASGEARQIASGSGVIISADGYIVTNNHVVEKAEELIVTLNDKKDYKAILTGTDPSSDLAVIKIEGNNFPHLTFANSDNVNVGQWILAIGYPLNLETTVTSGIVSAKARNIGINSHNSDAPIESFIQTDAAVNPGNSGGALVNTEGNLIGINSAIASPTGSYAGYSYAIPSNLVERVITDIIKYGSAKRPYLGVMYGSDHMNDADRAKNNIPDGDGVYVMKVASGSAAENAGIQKGDLITKINGIPINTGTQMLEKVSSLRPGDNISITYIRNGSESNVSATLQETPGDYHADSNG